MSRTAEPLAEFVHAALASGRSRGEVADALGAAGWSPPEIRAALAAWIDAPGVPPVPRPGALVSPRDALVLGILFLALGLFATHLGALVFALIDLRIADALDQAEPDRAWRIRWSIAVIAVAFPLWAWLALRSARRDAADPGARRSAVARWLTAVALFVAAATVLGDAVTLVAALLGGEVTLSFLLKAVAVAAIAGAIFLAYLPDAAAETPA